MLAPWKKSYDQPRECIKKQRHHFANTGSYSQSYGFSSSHVWISELDHKESWEPKNWCFEMWHWKKLLKVPRRSNQSILREINPEYSLEGLMLKLKLQNFGHLMGRAGSLEKTWCWDRLKVGGEGTTEDEIVGWHQRFNGHESEQTPGNSEGQGILACCSPWGWKELDTTEWTTTNCQMSSRGCRQNLFPSPVGTSDAVQDH